MRKAFTMVELVFAIVIIGILAGVAIPKFSESMKMAYNSKGKSTLVAVRNALATERQKRILRGDFTEITDLSAGNAGNVFDKFSADKDGTKNDVLRDPLPSCTNTGCWSGSGSTYTFYYDGGTCTYTLDNNKLTTSSCPVFGE